MTGLYLNPKTLDAALGHLSRQALTILAGGTDFYPARVGKPFDGDVLDLSRIDALRGITQTPSHWRIGALTTWSELIASPLPPLFDGYKSCGREVGGEQIQNTGTLGGNLCNASPAADGTPCLMALDAEVELASSAGARAMPVQAFVTGSRQTLKRQDELVTALLIPKRSQDTRSAFLKLGARRYLVISTVMIAGTLETDAAGCVSELRLSIGACSAAPLRLTALEQKLTGLKADAALAGRITPSDLDSLSPISDVRGSAEYRAEAALELTRRLAAELAAGIADAG